MKSMNVSDEFLYEVIRRPVITEKSSLGAAEANQYTFEVSDRSNRNQIKFAVEKLFDVEVKSVNIINVRGKIKIFRGHKGKRSGFKKAVVSLKEGQVIDLAGGFK